MILAGYLYRVIVDKHVTGPPKDGEIQIRGVWGKPSSHLHFSKEPPTDQWAWWQQPVYFKPECRE